MLSRFPNPTEIELGADKKAFVELFGELLKLENILRNFDEFEHMERIISERQRQDMQSVYVDIRDSWLVLVDGPSNGDERDKIDWSDVEFQIDLLRTDEINLDYILALILQKSKEHDNIEELKVEVQRVIRSSLGTRAKEELVIDFSIIRISQNLLKRMKFYHLFMSLEERKKKNRLHLSLKMNDSKRGQKFLSVRRLKKAMSIIPVNI